LFPDLETVVSLEEGETPFLFKNSTRRISIVALRDWR